MLLVGRTVSIPSYELASYDLVVSNTVSCFSERDALRDHSEQQSQMSLDQMMYRAACSNAAMSSINESLQYQAWQQQQQHQQQQLQQHQHQHQQQQQLNLQIHQQNIQEQQEQLHGRQQQEQQQQQPLNKQQRQQQPQQHKQHKQQQKRQQHMLQHHLQQHHQLQQQQLHQQQQLMRYAIESEQMASYYRPCTMPFHGLSYPQQLWAHARSQPNDGFPVYTNSSSYSSNNASSSSNCSSHTTSIVSSSNCGDVSENGRQRSHSFIVKPCVTGSATKQAAVSTATLATGQATGEFAKCICSLWHSRFLFSALFLQLDNIFSPS